MDLSHYISHPEQLDKETLYDLRNILALYPYYQPARLLMLKNLYLLHDPSFDEELRRAAIYITDRKTIFNIVEAAHYQLRREEQGQKNTEKSNDGDRTISLIDSFLDSLPEDEGENKEKGTRKPTAADAAVCVESARACNGHISDVGCGQVYGDVAVVVAINVEYVDAVVFGTYCQRAAVLLYHDVVGQALAAYDAHGCIIALYELDVYRAVYLKPREGVDAVCYVYFFPIVLDSLAWIAGHGGGRAQYGYNGHDGIHY